MKHEETMKKISPAILRIAIAAVFLWFGFNQITDAESWVFFLPDFLTNSISDPTTLVFLNGAFELFFGTFLLIGIYTRINAFILAVSMVGIVFSVGYNSIGVRDFGLAAATFAIALNGSDFLSLDEYFKRKSKAL